MVREENVKERQQRFFIFDVGRCFGCNGCVAACVNVNRTPGGVLWRRVHKLPPRVGEFHTIYISISCNHCENPPCVQGCPANALEKRESDGIVLHHAEKCVGCRYCQMACPYDAIKWNHTAKVVGKCHFCFERLTEGREPACVETCFAGALKQELSTVTEIQKKYKRESPGLVFLSAVGPSFAFVGQPDSTLKNIEKSNNEAHEEHNEWGV